MHLCRRRLAQTTAIDSAVLIHPGSIKKEDMLNFRVPSSFIYAERKDNFLLLLTIKRYLCFAEDHSFPDKLAKECEAILATRKGSGGPEYEFTEYKGS